MTKAKNLWNLSATREVTSAARPSRIPRQGCVEPLSTLASHQKIRPVKPGPGWSNLKLFPKLTPTQRASHGSGTICTTLHYLVPDCREPRSVGAPRRRRSAALRAAVLHVLDCCQATGNLHTSQLSTFNIQPPVQFPGTISAPFCTDFCTFCRHTCCKSVTYDPKLHHAGATGHRPAFPSFAYGGEPPRFHRGETIRCQRR